VRNCRTPFEIPCRANVFVVPNFCIRGPPPTWSDWSRIERDVSYTTPCKAHGDFASSCACPSGGDVVAALGAQSRNEVISTSRVCNPVLLRHGINDEKAPGLYIEFTCVSCAGLQIIHPQTEQPRSCLVCNHLMCVSCLQPQCSTCATTRKKIKLC